jgi:flavin reductase (DIM6/NTAB) family NADH-FMN oxidoreductase RutF
MTIGWGLIGSVWGRPTWQVMVRPSRYTFELLKSQSIFTINVLPKSHAGALTICGSKSGRDCDKLAECGLTVSTGKSLGAPVIDQSVIHYECHIVHSNDFIPEAMIPDIRSGMYPSGDYHRVFWGEIRDSRFDPEAISQLS